MPQDVPMGQGYMGDALLAAFPGQYRASEPVRTNPVNYLPQPPGAASGRPSYTDPDGGRQLKLVTMPGVGQVVVPVEHTMVGVGGPVVPVDYSMVGLSALAHSVQAEDLTGLGAHQAHAWGIDKIAKGAAAAAHEALGFVRQGKMRSTAEVEGFVKNATEKIGAMVTQRLQAKLGKVSAIVSQAVQQANVAIKPTLAKLLSSGARAGVRGGL